MGNIQIIPCILKAYGVKVIVWSLAQRPISVCI